MVMPKRKLLIAGAVVLLVIIIYTGRNGNAEETAEETCQMQVTANVLNVRAAPGTQHPIVEKLMRDALVEANTTSENGFRQIGDERWVAEEFLTPAPGATC